MYFQGFVLGGGGCIEGQGNGGDIWERGKIYRVSGGNFSEDWDLSRITSVGEHGSCTSHKPGGGDIGIVTKQIIEAFVARDCFRLQNCGHRGGCDLHIFGEIDLFPVFESDYF